MSRLLVLRRPFGILVFTLAVILIVGGAAQSINSTQAADAGLAAKIRFGPYPPMVYPMRVGISTRQQQQLCLSMGAGGSFY